MFAHGIGGASFDFATPVITAAIVAFGVLCILVFLFFLKGK